MVTKKVMIKAAFISGLAFLSLFFSPRKAHGEDYFWGNNLNVPESLTEREYGHSIYYREMNLQKELDKIDGALAIVGGAYILNMLNNRTQKGDTSQLTLETHFDIGLPLYALPKSSRLETELEKAQGYKPEGFLLGVELYKRKGDKWVGVKYTTDKTDENGLIIKNEMRGYSLSLDEEKIRYVKTSKKDRFSNATIQFNYKNEFLLITFQRKL